MIVIKSCSFEVAKNNGPLHLDVWLYFWRGIWGRFFVEMRITMMGRNIE